MTEVICTCGKPTAGAWLCDDCAKTMSYAIVHVGIYYLDLGNVEAKRARYGTQGATKGSIGKAQPLPVDLRFVNGAPRLDVFGGVGGTVTAPGNQLLWDVWNTTVAWTRTIMEALPEVEAYGPVCPTCWHNSCTTVRRYRWPQNTIPSMVNYLARQFRWVLKQQWAPDLMGEMLDLEHRLARFVDRPPDRWYAGKCSAVTMDHGADGCPTELYAQTDRGWIDCPTCNTRHDVAERRDYLLDEAKDYLVTATEAAGALLAWTDYDGTEAKLVDRIRKWRDRELLTVQDVTSLNGRDRHLYRLGDIQKLLVDAAQEQQRRRIGAA